MSYRGRGRPRSGDPSTRGKASSKRRRFEGDGFEAWGGYMNAKKQKLQDQFNTAGDDSDLGIFKGIHVYVDGYTRPSSDELRRLLSENDGVFEQYLYKTRVTHIVTTNLPDSKVNQLKGMKVARPEWITDSVAAGKLLPYTNYQLYSNQSKAQHGLLSYTKTSVLSRTTSVSSTVSHDQDNQSAGLSYQPEIDDPLNEDDTSDEDLAILRTKDIENALYTKLDDKLCDGESREAAPLTMKSAESLTGSYHGNAQAMKMAKAGDSNFLPEYYTHSRLHHISTWGSEFKAYVTQLQKEGDGTFPGRQRLIQFHQDNMTNGVEDRVPGCHGHQSGRPKRVIMHVDMDCFFVSVGLLDKPELRGRPVAVTHSKGKGAARETTQQQELNGLRSVNGVTSESKVNFHSFAEIASCSYEARQAGVKNGMFMGPAKQLCPDLVTIPYNFDKYQEVSRILYDTVASFTHDVEAVSCDELLVDCTDLLACTGGTAEEFATLLRMEIYNKTGCTASAGLGGKILVARLATRTAKPNGQFYVTADAVPEFIMKQSVRNLPGVGYSMTKKLTSLKVVTCADLQKLALGSLQKEFGPKTGQSLYQYCRGQDDRQIKMEKERKSVSAEINYGIRFQKALEAEKFVSDLSEEVSTRLKNINMRGKTITLKIMVRKEDAPKESAKFMGHGRCNNLSKSSSLPVATDDHVVIAKECVAMYRALRIRAEDLRGVGIQTHRLEVTTLGRSRTHRDNQGTLSFAIATKDQHSSTTVSKTPELSSDSDVHSVEQGYDGSERELETGQQEQDGESLLFTASCPTIRDELERRRNASTELPPLPTLPQFDSPSPEPPVSPRADVTQPRDYFPSPSQIDPEVLKELPPDIRQQIEKDMATKRGHSKPKQIITTNREADGEPGCSHWPSQESTNQETVTEIPQAYQPANNLREERDREAVTSYSQLDKSFLDALPEELQEELRAEYSRRDQRHVDLTVATVPPLQLQQAKSPSKSRGATRRSPHKSPSKRKTSPVFKVPRGRPAGRGRPPGHRNKKQSDVRTRTRLTKNTVVRNLDKTVYEVQQAPVPSTSEPDAVAETQTDISDDSVSLCGAVTIREVRDLLAEWLEACPVPQSEDVSVIMEYLGQLVIDQNLEQVDLVLKFFNRKTRKLNNKAWRMSFDTILTNTQDLIKSVHGSTLNVDWLSAR